MGEKFVEIDRRRRAVKFLIRATFRIIAEDVFFCGRRGFPYILFVFFFLLPSKYTQALQIFARKNLLPKIISRKLRENYFIVSKYEILIVTKESTAAL